MGKAQDQTAELDSPHTEASKLLEAALQQMDGIISGNRMVSSNPALEAADRLAVALQDSPLPPPPDPSTAAVIRSWLAQLQMIRVKMSNQMHNYKERNWNIGPNLDERKVLRLYQTVHHVLNLIMGILKMTPAEADEQLRRLEGDKQSLSLQVTVLNEQIEAQSEKISDLEKALEEQKKQISNSENLLQREVLSRSSLETQKLELLAVVSELKRQQACLERENVDLRERLGDERRRQKPPVAPRSSPFPPHTSTPNRQQAEGQLYNSSPTPSPILQNNVRKLSEENSSPILHQTGFHNRIGNQQYSSLPRQHHLQSENAAALKNRVAFGRNHLFLLHSGVLPTDRCSSVPNLAESETVVISDTASEADVSNANGNYSQNTPPSLQINKARGIKKIFTRIKRSGSGSLDDISGDGEFRRGGVRATANARLGWTTNQTTRSDQPFSEWNTDTLCAWLTELGLDYCATEAKRWIKSGTQLLNATQSEVDKELGIKNPLHRKKLHLALYCERGGVSDSHLNTAGLLGTPWVLRWLDDVGLPQHKDTFLAARIDGRLLHRLTVDDLASLHVSNALHVASIRTGIQVLRNNNFDGNCLIRRSAPEESENVGPSEIALWTNHRVMEWLRAVDLAEYAPNLRGSGVHGGLLVHEPRFTGELLASLLSIPPGKTLLRRHLTTHFKDLLGRDVIQEKRDAEASLGYVPLTTTAKVKVAKKSQFTLKRKKSKGELDYGELVCPLDGTRNHGEALQGDQQNQSQSHNSPHQNTTSTTTITSITTATTTTTTSVSPLPAAARQVQNQGVVSLESVSSPLQKVLSASQSALQTTDRSSNV